jgi:hypothetical protein
MNIDKETLKIGDKVTLPKGYGYIYSTCDFKRVKKDFTFVVTYIDNDTYINDIHGFVNGNTIRVNSQFLTFK